MRKLDITEIKRLTPEDFKEAEKNPLIVVLDNIRSHHNTGAVFRTCDAFACEAVYLCGITGTPPHRDIHKTALGATETVHWEYFENTMEAVKILKSKNYKLIALEIAENSTHIDEYLPEKNEKTALILGNEVNGIDQKILDICDICIEIPQYGTKHSLNVSVSGGIAIWTLTKKMRYN
ncbi:MAG: RNA methyltransferase [Bacteroidales bacterium]|jgi:tRNA G18 (ribose-2'-O)-methylase SpoU|nr:RNA methyltransferase [Bacteroidales bacterium]